jgi:hypothetical protein
MVLGSYSSDGHGSEPVQPTVSQTTIAKSVSLAERPDESSVVGRPAIAKDPSRYDAPVGETANGPPLAKKDPTRYGSIPVALVHVWKFREQSAMADIEAAPSTVAAVHSSSAASHIHASHASRRMGRHEPRSVYRVKQARARVHNEPRQMAGIAARRVQHSQIRNVR